MLVTNILIELKLNECALRGGLIESHVWMAIKTTNRVELDPSNWAKGQNVSDQLDAGGRRRRQFRRVDQREETFKKKKNPIVFLSLPSFSLGHLTGSNRHELKIMS